jgi:hypothetical protein
MTTVEGDHAVDEQARDGSYKVEGLWASPKRFGYHESVKGIGGVVAPLLAGFSLATIAALVAAEPPARFADEAIFALATAASLLLYSMQVAFMAMQHHATPAELLSWYPEGIVNKRSLDDLRARQAKDRARIDGFVRRYANSYELGLLMFLLGLWLLVWPDGADPAPARVGALVAVGLAFLVELWWSIARLYNDRQDRRGTGRRMPHPAGGKPPSAIDLAAATETALAGVLDPERRTAAKLTEFPDLTADGKGAGR